MGDLKMKFMAILFVAMFPSLLLAQDPGSALVNFEKDHGSVDGIVDQVIASDQGISEGFKIRKLFEAANGSAIDDATARHLYVEFVDKAQAKAAAELSSAEKKFGLKEKDIEAALDKHTGDLDGQNPGKFLAEVAAELRSLSKGHVPPTKAEAMKMARLAKIQMDALWVKPRRNDVAYLNRLLGNGKAEFKSVTKSRKEKSADSGGESVR